MYIHIPGIKYNVDAVSVAEYDAIGDDLANESKRLLIDGGGFLSTFISQDALDAAAVQFKGTPWEKEVATTVAGPVIVMLAEVAAELTEEEKLAILLHEEGHIVAEHGSKATKFIGKIVDHVEFELEADAYAAARIGGSILKSALVKVITAAITMKTAGRMARASQIRSALNSSDMLRRFAALA